MVLLITLLMLSLPRKEGRCIRLQSATRRVTQQSGHKNNAFFFVFVLNYKSEVNFLSQVSQASPSCPGPFRLLVLNRSPAGLHRWAILCQKHVFHEWRQKHGYTLSMFPHETDLFEQENLTSAGEKENLIQDILWEILKKQNCFSLFGATSSAICFFVCFLFF